MTMVAGHILVMTGIFAVVVLIEGRCKWSNEGCSADSECCSDNCDKRHLGTDPRCEKSPLRHPCLYNYHCERRAICGPKNTCCSDYWNDCRDKDDCCDPQHVCIYARGFVYKKCLYGPVVRGENSGNTIEPFKVIILFLFAVWKSFLLFAQ